MPDGAVREGCVEDAVRRLSAPAGPCAAARAGDLARDRVEPREGAARRGERVEEGVVRRGAVVEAPDGLGRVRRVGEGDGLRLGAEGAVRGAVRRLLEVQAAHPFVVQEPAEDGLPERGVETREVGRHVHGAPGFDRQRVGPALREDEADAVRGVRAAELQQHALPVRPVAPRVRGDGRRGHDRLEVGLDGGELVRAAFALEAAESPDAGEEHVNLRQLQTGARGRVLREVGEGAVAAVLLRGVVRVGQVPEAGEAPGGGRLRVGAGRFEGAAEAVLLPRLPADPFVARHPAVDSGKAPFRVRTVEVAPRGFVETQPRLLLVAVVDDGEAAREREDVEDDLPRPEVRLEAPREREERVPVVQIEEPHRPDADDAAEKLVEAAVLL